MPLKNFNFFLNNDKINSTDENLHFMQANRLTLLRLKWEQKMAALLKNAVVLSN